MRPLSQRFQQTKDQVVESDTIASARESAAPAMTRTLKSIASTVQGRVEDASSTVAARARQVVSRGSEALREDGVSSPFEKDGTMPLTAEDYRAEVTPKPGIDPIPEGDPNDPTLVARVESELFRDETLPNGKLNIDAVGGVVTLRGTVDGKGVAEDILERTRAIEGVTDVVDLLHRR
ncbi:MAG: BON domain-containing protein [Chloroflexota bacterium]